MKKSLLSLMAFLSYVGAWAGVTDLPEITTDPANPIYYTIYNTRSGNNGDSGTGGLIYYAGDEVGLKDGDVCEPAVLQDKYKFYFTGSHDALYVHNAATTKKLASVNSWTDEGIVWELKTPTQKGVAVGPKGSDVSARVWWNELNYSNGYTTWNADDAGSIFVFEPADQYVFPETGKFYTIECPLFEKVQNVKKGLYVKDDGSLAWGTVDLTSKNHYWVPTFSGDGTLVLKNLGTEKYLYGNSMSETEVSCSVRPLGSNQFNIIVGTTTIHASGHSNGQGADGGTVSWQGIVGSASAWSFFEQRNPDEVTVAEVIYSFRYNGVEKFTQSTEALVDGEYPAITITSSFPWGIAATKPEGTIQATDVVDGVVTKTIELVATTPFVCAESFDAVATWYYFKIKPGEDNPLYYDPTKDYMDATKQSADYDNIDAYAWAFVGNPFDGFQIVNKAAGSSMSLTSPEPTADQTYPVLGEGAQVWDFSASTYGTNGFYIAYHGTSKKMNKQGGKVCYWLGGADAGSTFTAEAIDMSGGADLISELDKAKVWQACIGTSVGHIDAESATDLNTAIANAETALETGTGGFACINPLKAAIAKLKTVQPNPAAYYRIVSASTHEYCKDKVVYINSTGGMQFAAEANQCSLGSVFRFETVGEDKYCIYNVERGVYMGKLVKPTIANALTLESADTVVITNMGKESIVSLDTQKEGHSMLHAQNDYSVIVAWDNTDPTSASAWRLVEVDIASVAHNVTINVSGWATLYLGYDAAIPEGIVAYTVPAVTTTHAKMEEVTDGVIPANTAVLINGVAGNYDFGVAATGATAPTTNLLKGSVFNTLTEGKSYILATLEDVTAFYNVTLDKDGTGAEGTTHFENNAFKAYLPNANENAGRLLNFDFGTETGIENIEGAENANSNAVIYDLSGRRVLNAQKGIYVVNGKKVIK